MLRSLRASSSARNMSTAPLDSSKLTINRNSSPRALDNLENLTFGKTLGNHMLTVKWTQGKGWGVPEINPFANLTLSPATSALHYGFQCFEGLKAYKDSNGDARIFRPEKNMARLNSSAERICLPTFDIKEGLKLVEKFVEVEKDIIPNKKGYALYLRPTMIGTQDTLGIGPPASALFYIIASPVGPYFPTGFEAIKLEATESAVRAWPGGIGNRKVGGNYAPCILPQQKAAERGFQQNLWLLDGYLTEAGSMNLFVVFQNKDGTKELCTPCIDGTILEGILRMSILDLARQRLGPDWVVNERKIHMDEVEERYMKGELLEVFGSGTAVVVCPVKEINYRGDAITVPLQAGKECGPLTEQVSEWISDIQYGVEDHPFCKKI